MRGIVGLILLAGCAEAKIGADASVDATEADAAVPDGAPLFDATTSSGFFLDDEVADFDGTLTDLVVEAFGAVGPRAYHTGGLRARASESGVFTDATTSTWAQVQGMTFTAVVAPAGLASNWGAGAPIGLGMIGVDDYTVALDGEIYLEAGTWTFYVLADDHAFLELAPIGGSTFTRVVSANWPTESSTTYVAAAAGWYPIRVASCDQTGGASLRVEAAGPGIARAPLSRHRLRFLASGMFGLTIGGFDDSHLLGDHAVSIEVGSPAAHNWGVGQPGDLALTGGDDFSVRWSGQLRIDDDGDYAFRYISDAGQRLWVDGALLLDQLDDASHDSSTVPTNLDRGWHDLVIDHTEATGVAQAFVGIVSGPDLVSAALPVDHLRPVVGRAERYDTGVDHTDRAIPDLGQVESTITIDAPAGAKAYGVDVGWTFDHQYHDDLQISLIAPDGSLSILRDSIGDDASGSATERLHTITLDDATASGVWRLRVRDTVSLDTGTLRDFQLTVHHHAGAPPIAETASYESSIKDLGDMVTSYQAFAWRDRLATGTAIRMYARSADTAVDVVAAPWSDPMIDPNGGPPPVQARRFFQYKIEFDSDGDHSALVDWVRLDVTEEVQ